MYREGGGGGRGGGEGEVGVQISHQVQSKQKMRKKNNTINPISSAYVQYSSGGHFDTQSTTRTNIFSAMLPRRKERR